MSVLTLLPEDKRRKEVLANVYSSNSRLSLLSKRKRLNPLTGDMSNHSLNSRGDKYVAQRVLSAKTHRVKQLQNQLADAHYHLQELSNENKVLRALQKKQEIALQRYENSNAELPSVLHSHSEEIRIQLSKYKQLKQQHREVTQKLKEKEMQLQLLRDEHNHLLELSKDKNLLEREKLQAQVADLSAKVHQQNETITMLQRRLTLEAKNFKHQLQHEINKHKDTRQDLDLAISNADKLSTIIGMKEKMLSHAASRTVNVRSPTKATSTANIKKEYATTRSALEQVASNKAEAREQPIIMAKFCENSRSLSSALSHDAETSSSAEPRSRYIRSRINSSSNKSTPNQTRKGSKESEEIIEIAKTIQNGMADLKIQDKETELRNETPEQAQKKIEAMKVELMKKIKNNEEPGLRKSSLRTSSTELSIEEQGEEIERPRSRGMKSSISFYEDVFIEENTTTVVKNDISNGDELLYTKPKRENSNLEKKLSGKPIDKFCKEIIRDIEKSNKIIEKHVTDFNSSRFESDKIVQQLQAVDKINELVNFKGEIPTETLTELNNNFEMLTNQVLSEVPVARKRSVSGRRNSRPEANSNLFGDSDMTNRELLEDLLGKK